MSIALAMVRVRGRGGFAGDALDDGLSIVLCLLRAHVRKVALVPLAAALRVQETISKVELALGSN